MPDIHTIEFSVRWSPRMIVAPDFVAEILAEDRADRANYRPSQMTIHPGITRMASGEPIDAPVYRPVTSDEQR
jgi:hypothetical protein